jgi:chaperone modulatory protein CbpM
MNSPDVDLIPSDSDAEERVYTYQQVAQITAVSVTLVQRFVSLNLVDAQNATLTERELTRIVQMLRLRRDLGLNWVGASMVLDLCRENAQLKARLQAYAQYLESNQVEEP